MNENEIKAIVADVIAKMTNETATREQVTSMIVNNLSSSHGADVIVDDITKIDLKSDFHVKDACNEQAYLKMKSYTSARLGISRTGTRYLTTSSLRFRADHAAAMDAVFSMVDTKVLESLNEEILSIKTICTDKDQYLTRPDYGKLFDEQTTAKIASFVNKQAQVQIIIGDGLSSAAIEANIADILPSIQQGLKNYNISFARPIFVEYCRVGAMDAISEISNAQVTLMLIGERPGLVSAKSMSAYIAYDAKVGMPEARRTVISNIHQGGTPAVEAGAHVASIIKRMLETKTSGVDLKL